MSTKKVYQNILEHPDKDDIISKLIMDVPVKEISDSLRKKYGIVDDKKLLVSDKVLLSFKDDYLDFYQIMQKDLQKEKESRVKLTKELVTEEVQSNPDYKKRLNAMLDQEIDIKTTIKKLILQIEMRAEQVFDSIQRNPNSTSKADYVLIQYFNTLTSAVEKLNKVMTGAPDQVIQHNVTIQTIDSHVHTFQEIIREVITFLEPQVAYKFIDLCAEKFASLKEMQPQKPMSTEERMAEVRLLGEKILEK